MSCNSTQHLTKNCNLVTYYPHRGICLKNRFNLINSTRSLFSRKDIKVWNSRKNNGQIKASVEKFNEKNDNFSFISFQKQMQTYDTESFSVSFLTGQTQNLDEEEEKKIEKMVSQESKEEEEDKSPVSSSLKKAPGAFVWSSNGDMKSYERKRDELQEFLLKFDKMASFKLYFPQNNFINVIKKFKSKGTFAE